MEYILLVLIIVGGAVVFWFRFMEEINRQKGVTKEFAKTQLIGQDRFIEAYHPILKELALSRNFTTFVMQLREELNGLELTDTKEANRRIASYFYFNNANDRFPEVKEIVKGVTAYGKQASAHISIYYAMYIYDM